MHVVVLALLGGLVGNVVLGGSLDGFLSGAALGGLLGAIDRLRHRVGELRARVTELERRVSRAAAEGTAGAAENAAAVATAGSHVAESERARDEAPPEAAAPRFASAASVPRTSPPPAASPPADRRVVARASSPAARSEHARRPAAAEMHATSSAARAASPRAVEPSLLERGAAALQAWFTTGNVPVKIGVILSVFGVGFLVKEAVDRNWMVVPLELRLIFVALFGLALLGIGWRLREGRRSYALSLQGGGIAMLYVTIYASFALYGLLPGALAFALLLAVTASGATLAVLQDARALAVLGIVGGFMAPLLTSSGAGNHVVLFGYYALLDVAIFAIAWFKAWRALNVLGFIFTFGIGSLWGIDAYRPELFASTEPFLVLFVLLYMLIPVLFASRQPPELKGLIDGTLVFGTPLVGFALQSRLVADTEYGLAASALGLAALYAALAESLRRRAAPELRTLAEAHFGLAAVFLAVAVPLALDARWTSAAWAVQGAAMVWLGVRQRRRLAFAGGVLLQLAAGAALSGHLGDALPTDALLVSAGAFGAVLIAFAGGFSAWCVDRGREALEPAPRDGSVVAGAFLAWGTAWWLFAGGYEIERLFRSGEVFAAFLHFVGATVLVAMLTASRLAWPRLNAVGLLGLPFIVLGALAWPLWHSHPFDGYASTAWLVLFAAHYVFLQKREAQFPRWQLPAHTFAYWALAFLIALEVRWQVAQLAEGVWALAAAMTTVAGLVLLTLRSGKALQWPLEAHRAAYAVNGCGGVLAGLVVVTVAANALSTGAAAGVAYVPIANPLELASIAVVAVACRWWILTRGELRPPAPQLRQLALVPALLGLFVLTMSVARTVHHWDGVPFDFDALAASTALQAALSIAWGSAALAGMLVGARTGRRDVWLAGAGLMGVVVVKLFVVELGNAGTVGRVVSFLGVGLLLLVVGYLAPVPPRLERREA